jgi:hypothetical protein
MEQPESVIPVAFAFLPHGAFADEPFRPYKDLADDKERYATHVAENITPHVSSTYSYV